MTYYLTDNSHMLITGATGAGSRFGGKSSTANWLFEQSVDRGHFEAGVYFDPKGHSFIRGETVRSLGDLVGAWQRGQRLFHYVPTEPEPEHSNLIQALRNTTGQKIIVHDEAHSVADSDMLDWCVRQGGNVGQRFATGDIRSVVVSQHPWDLPESVGQNVPLMVWVGPKTQQAKRYFDTMGIGSAFAELPDAPPYHWTVIDAGEIVKTHAAVPEAYAK